MSTPNGCQTADGLDKKPWPNRAAAAFVAHLRAREYGHPLAVYECPTCSRWHVTKSMQYNRQNQKLIVTGEEPIASIVALR